MFDDKPTNTNHLAGNVGSDLPGAAPPQNLPTGGAERPTPTPPPTPLPTASKVSEPEDILADIDQVEDAPVKSPAQPGKAPTVSTPPAVAPPERPVTKEPFFKQHKKAFAVIIAVLVVGVLGAGGWYGYNLFISSQTGPVVEQPTNAGSQDSTVNQDLNQPVNNNQPPTVNQNVNQASAIDTDHDGLTDEEEAMYGTDPQKIDTDDDALTDRDEIKVFKTDPNNSDTDGDGYLDGDEVRAGYDPKGPGRLLKIE